MEIKERAKCQAKLARLFSVETRHRSLADVRIECLCESVCIYGFVCVCVLGSYKCVGGYHLLVK